MNETERHAKWQPVEPGTVIPAGQPHAIRVEGTDYGLKWGEYVMSNPTPVPNNVGEQWFIDSSWRPPLELPTEPTWGVLKVDPASGLPTVGRFYLTADGEIFGTFHVSRILDFIPLTPEQVARIEGQR